MVPFTLYGLLGCPHCSEAEKFLRSRGIATILVIANDDPIAKEGVLAAGREAAKAKAKAAGASETETAAAIAAVVDEYPVLVSRLTKEIIRGYKQEDYERLANIVFALNGSGAPSVFSGQQQPVTQAPVQTQAA